MAVALLGVSALHVADVEAVNEDRDGIRVMEIDAVGHQDSRQTDLSTRV